MPSLVNSERLTGSRDQKSKILPKVSLTSVESFVTWGLFGGLAGAFGSFVCLGFVCLLFVCLFVFNRGLISWFRKRIHSLSNLLFFSVQTLFAFSDLFQVFLCKINASNTQKFSLRKAMGKNKKHHWRKSNKCYCDCDSCLFFLCCKN